MASDVALADAVERVPTQWFMAQSTRESIMNWIHEPQDDRNLDSTAILILALDVARDTYGVPALAGRASANPHRWIV